MTPEPARPASPLRAAIATAWISGVFLACVLGVMIFQRATATSNDPWKSPQLLELKARLQDSPKDEAIKVRIRELDLKFRQRYVRRLVLDRTGGWLLLAGSVALVLSLKTARDLRRLPPRPLPDPEAGQRALQVARASRRAVAAGGAILAVSLGAVVLGIRSSLSDTPPAISADREAATGPAGSSGPAAATPAEFLANWPRFRGPLGDGVATHSAAPLTWDGPGGKGIAWKVPVPAPGFNSPIIWGERLFFSGATPEKREVLCYDRMTGALLWQRTIENVPGSPAKPPKIPDETGFAAPTMATDGRHAYAIFGNGDLAALSFSGAVVWSKNLGSPKNPWGHATSLALWEGTLYIQMDQGESRPANSRLLALDGATGRIRWEKPRPVPSSWATPIVIEAAGRKQLITLGLPYVISYSPEDGREWWRAQLLDGEVTPSPVLAGGALLVIHPDNALIALKTDGDGDVTGTPPLWKGEDNVPDVSSPVSNGELVFTVSSHGMLTCWDLKDGQKVWEQDLKTEAWASPALAGGRLYVTCTDGTTVVAEAGRAYRELARNRLGEKLLASPAFAGGRIYYRGAVNLYCLAADDAPRGGP